MRDLDELFAAPAFSQVATTCADDQAMLRS